jgi:hypothetical protein
MAISEINVRAAMNVLMTHLHVAEHCPRRQVKKQANYGMEGNPVEARPLRIA